MKALCFSEPQKVDVREIPAPTLESEGDVVVRVTSAGLCGSDLHPFFGRESGLDAGTVMGHEFVGEVVELGTGVDRYQTGDRVCAPFTTNCGRCFYCRRGLTSRCQDGQLFGWRAGGKGLHGGQAEYVRVPHADATLVKIPETMEDEAALLLGDNLSTAYYGTDLAFPDTIPADAVCVVVGCGTVGLLAVSVLIARHARNVIAIDPNEARRSVAIQRGVTQACPSHKEAKAAVSRLSDGRGADAVLEFVGLPDAQASAFDLLRPGGTLATIGCHCDPHFAFSPASAYDKNLTYRTGRCPARHYMDQLPRWLGETQPDLSWCISHRFPIDDAVEAYDVFANRRDNCIKAVLTF